MQHYSRAATTSVSLAQSQFRTRKLYRHALKVIPWMKDTYALEYDKKDMRDTIRGLFERQAHVKDRDLVDVLVFQGENDLQEALNIWKTRSHVVKFFEPTEVDKRTILDKLLEGEELPYTHDENSPLWTYPKDKERKKFTPEEKKIIFQNLVTSLKPNTTILLLPYNTMDIFVTKLVYHELLIYNVNGTI